MLFRILNSCKDGRIRPCKQTINANWRWKPIITLVDCRYIVQGRFILGDAANAAVLLSHATTLSDRPDLESAKLGNFVVSIPGLELWCKL